MDPRSVPAGTLLGIREWDRSRSEIEGSADDAVGVEAVVPVDVLERTDLTEPAHSERSTRNVVDSRQEREGVRVPVESSDSIPVHGSTRLKTTVDGSGVSTDATFDAYRLDCGPLLVT